MFAEDPPEQLLAVTSLCQSAKQEWFSDADQAGWFFPHSSACYRALPSHTLHPSSKWLCSSCSFITKAFLLQLITDLQETVVLSWKELQKLRALRLSCCRKDHHVLPTENIIFLVVTCSPQFIWLRGSTQKSNTMECRRNKEGETKCR